MDIKQKVKKFISALLKTIKSYKLYKNRSDLPEKFLKETFGLLKEVLEEGALKLEINPESISYQGTVLYEDKNKLTSLPLFLYRNGIRNITFLEGLDYPELEKFVKIISKSEFISELNLSEDLWEENFVNIVFTIVELPMEDYSWIVQERMEAYQGGMKFAGISTIEKGEKGKEHKEQSTGFFDQSLYEDRDDALIRTIFNVLSLEKNQDRLVQVISTLGEYLDRSVDEGDIVPLLIFVKYYEEQAKSLHQTYEYLQDLRRIICGEKTTKLYTFIIKKGEKSLIPVVMELLNFCGENSIKVIEDTVSELSDTEILRGMQRLLYRIGKRNPDTIAHILETHNPVLINLALDVVKVLNNRIFIPQLENLIKNGRFKEKAIKVLMGLLPREKLFEMIVSNDRSIRINAYKMLNYISSEEEEAKLLEKVNSADFWNLDTDERRYILKILATHPSYDTVRAFSRILSKYTINPEHIETKKYAIKLLGDMQNDDAYKVLRKYRWSRHLRKTIKEVLKKYEKG